LFAVITGALGIKNLISGLQETHPVSGNGESLGQALINTLKDIVTHQKFRECGINKSRNVAHMLLVYAFAGLAVTTACVVVIHYGNHFFGWFGYDTPLPFFHPVKILGNISALAGICGILLIAGRRLTSAKVGKSVAFDWIFITDVVLVIGTGILAQVVRNTGNNFAFFIYYLHLVFVFFLFAYAPHSKFGHMFYRTAALVYARYSGRNQPAGVQSLEKAEAKELPEETKE